MRSQPDLLRTRPDLLRRTAMRLALVLSLWAAWPVALFANPAAAPVETPAAASAATSAPASALPLERVRAAASAVAADPLLGGERMQRTLKWVNDDKKKDKDKPDDAAAWLKGLAEWLADAGRLLAWLAFAVALALLAVLGWRLWGRRPVAAIAEALPTHVGQLDIRPDSLPEPVGQAAAALWQAGEGRAALALLYRAALSRLVHRHRVRVRSASTEQECLQLAAPHLTADAHAFLGILIDAWLRCGYAHTLPSNDTMAVLCARFDIQLGRPTEDAPQTQPGAAA
ncbi:MAG: DUF4129 domain-containing protein [Burkholderiales bacterium PBB6]|nr:MAG: DUF4129 domain-containing protein [Burkholderiales bacterium PBB6]